MGFMDSLNQKLADIKKPPLPPIGVYRVRVSKQPTMDTIANGKYETLDFPLQALEAVDVDQEAFHEFGGAKNVQLRLRFLFNTDPTETVNYERSLNRLKRFLTVHLGQAETLTTKEAIDTAVGKECLAVVTHRADNEDPEVFYIEVSKTMPLVPLK